MGGATGPLDSDPPALTDRTLAAHRRDRIRRKPVHTSSSHEATTGFSAECASCGWEGAAELPASVDGGALGPGAVTDCGTPAAFPGPEPAGCPRSASGRVARMPLTRPPARPRRVLSARPCSGSACRLPVGRPRAGEGRRLALAIDGRALGDQGLLLNLLPLTALTVCRLSTRLTPRQLPW